MNFSHTIAGLLSALPQGQAASLMGFDGLPVAEATGSTLPCLLATWLTEYAQTLVTLRRAAKEVPEGGQPLDVVVHTTEATVLLMPVGQAHFLAVVQHRDAPIGRARYYMKLTAEALAHEL